MEFDSLVAVWLGLTAEHLIAIYRARFPQLVTYENEMYFDADGHKITENPSAYGTHQAKEIYRQLRKHLEDPEAVSPPEGYRPPFYKADREAEMRRAHAVFAEHLRAADGSSQAESRA